MQRIISFFLGVAATLAVLYFTRDALIQEACKPKYDACLSYYVDYTSCDQQYKYLKEEDNE